MRKIIVTALFTSIASIFAGSTFAQNDAAPPHRFFLIGGSHAAGLQVELRSRTGLDHFGFDSLSKVGTRAVGWTKSGLLQKRLKEFDPDIVLVSFGTDEAKYDTSISVLALQFQTFVNAISDRGRRRIIWLAPPDLTGVNYLANVRDALKQVKGIEIIDVTQNEYGLTPSGVLLTHAANIAWAGDIWDKIRPTVVDEEQ